MISTGIVFEQMLLLPASGSFLRAALVKGDIYIMNMLIEHGETSDQLIMIMLNLKSIHYLAAGGFLNSLKLIIEKFYPSTDEIFTPVEFEKTILHFTALSGHHGTLKYLLSLPGALNYVNIRNNNGSTALLCACSRGHIECVRELLKHEETNILIPR